MAKCSLNIYQLNTQYKIIVCSIFCKFVQFLHASLHPHISHSLVLIHWFLSAHTFQTSSKRELTKITQPRTFFIQSFCRIWYLCDHACVCFIHFVSLLKSWIDVCLRLIGEELNFWMQTFGTIVENVSLGCLCFVITHHQWKLRQLVMEMKNKTDFSCYFGFVFICNCNLYNSRSLSLSHLL